MAPNKQPFGVINQGLTLENMGEDGFNPMEKLWEYSFFESMVIPRATSIMPSSNHESFTIFF